MTQTETSTSDLKQAIMLLIQDSKESKQRWEERQAKAEAEWEERQVKAEAAAERKNLTLELGDIARKQGLTAEYFVYPNIERAAIPNLN